MQILIHKVIRSKLLRNAYHEAGHYVLALLFYDILELEELTINKEKVKAINKGWAGALHLIWHKKPANNDINAGDHMILIALAGICARTIFIQGREYVIKNYSKFKNNPKLMDTTGAGDDYEIVQKFTKPISLTIGTLHQQIEWSGFFFVYMYFLDKYVLAFVQKIAEELIRSADRTLTNTELIKLAQEIGFIAWIDQNRSKILQPRYPLDKKKLIFFANESF